ncbi:MAG TPA: YrvL family regulatory protein [Sporosarcina sp.]|nr:YrvL family regulatory protein [Sporosarcina sp.]
MIVVTIALAIVILVPVIILFGGILIGLAGFFSLIGVTYDSLWALAIFLIACFGVSFFFEIIEVLILMKVERAKITGTEKLLWLIVIKGLCTWIVIYIVNGLMTSVNLSISAQLLTTVLIVAVDLALDDTPKKRKTDENVRLAVPHFHRVPLFVCKQKNIRS